MIRNNIKHVLDDKNLNIAEACNKTGLHRSVMGRLYRNELIQVSFDVIDKVCRGLDISVEQFLEYVSDEEMTDDDLEHLKIRNEYIHNSYWNKHRKKDGTIRPENEENAPE